MRKRIETEPKLKSWDDVDSNLMEILENEVEIARLEGEMNLAISELMDKYKAKVAPKQDRIKVLEKEMQEFSDEHRTDMGGKKSLSLIHGVVSYRQSTKLNIPKKLIGEAIQKLRLMGLVACITVKEDINKDELKKQPMETLIKVGASLKIDDVFGYETNKETIPEGR